LKTYNRLLTVAQYKEASQKVDGGAFDKMIFLVSVVNDLDILEVQDWRGDKLIRYYRDALEMMQIKTKHKQAIKLGGDLSTLGGNLHTLIQFKDLTLGMFIDLESSVEDISKVCAILYTSGEKYSKIDIEERTKLMSLVPVSDVHGTYQSYLKFRDSFFKSYDIFSDPFEGINVDELDEEEKEIYQAEMKEREKQGDQWMVIVNALANNDITKFEKVLGLNLFLCFNQLTFLKSTNS
jgi:hypothetical protein